MEDVKRLRRYNPYKRQFLAHSLSFSVPSCSSLSINFCSKLLQFLKALFVFAQQLVE